MPPGTGTGPCHRDLSTIGIFGQMPPGTGTGPCHGDLSTIRIFGQMPPVPVPVTGIFLL
jgi:hypothetical protein